MNFNSIEFLLFIPAVFLCLLLAGERFRWVVLLGASCYFYLTLKHLYLLVALLFVSVLTYVCGLLLEKARGRWRLAAFWGGVGGNLLVLIGMKYLPFLERNLNAVCGRLSLPLSVPEGAGLVSIGISYFVFQAISYLIDVLWGVEKPERHLGVFTLYLAFFPKLLQGPIERGRDLLPQLKSEDGFDQENFRAGLLQFCWGMFKKAVVADRLALYVNAVYGDAHSFSGLPLLIATYLYAFQLYYDFSGYTDMALGIARMFNIRLTQNFNAPYLARSLADFWRRWHISFSRWILDYIFQPLQMQLRYWRTAGTAVALLITFLVSGLWHGASWCFVIWGALHGIYLASSVLYKPYQKKLYLRLGLDRSRVQQVWQIAVTFNLVCFAWIFFRASTVADALYVASHLFSGTVNLKGLVAAQGTSDLAIAGLSMAAIWLVGWARERTVMGREFFLAPVYLRWGVYLALAALVLVFNMDSNAGFIYFNF